MSRPLKQRALEATGLASAGVFLGALVTRLAGCVDGFPGLAIVTVGAFVGYAIADIVSGAVHWFCDRVFDEQTRVIGRMIIEPFREHHRDPRAMGHHGMLELLGNSALGTAPILWMAWRCFDGLFLDATTVAFGAGVIASNVFHAWAHELQPSRTVAWLQARWFVLPPEQHARHHRGAHDVAYCMTTGWMNALADRLRVFMALERVLRALRVPVVSG
jgi:ubiquitin-conjugating enzyme E2 variant